MSKVTFCISKKKYALSTTKVLAHVSQICKKTIELFNPDYRTIHLSNRTTQCLSPYISYRIMSR